MLLLPALRLLVHESGFVDDDPATMMTRINMLVAQGADLNRANVLHCAVANGFQALLEPLITKGTRRVPT